MVPGFWLSEAGQTAAGTAIDMVLKTHPWYPNVEGNTHTEKIKFLNEVTKQLFVLFE